MTFNHSGAYLASADKSGVIKYFEPNMNNLTAWQGSNSREAIRDISFSPDDQRFATASDDSSVRIWSFAESRVESVLTGKHFNFNQRIFQILNLSRSWLGCQMRTVAPYQRHHRLWV
jgi:WD40 repeat protein